MPDVRLIFSTGSLYPLDTWRCFELAKEAGFDGIEIMCDDRWATRDPLYLNRLMETFDLPILVCHTPFGSQVPGWGHAPDPVGMIYRTLELAGYVGARSIVVHVPRRIGWVNVRFNGQGGWRLPWLGMDGVIKQWIERELKRVQAQTPIRIGLENLPARQLLGLTIDPTWWNEVASWSRVHDWLTLDTTHWATKRVDPLDAYQAAGGRVCHIHLSNYDGREHRLPQAGMLDLGKFLRHLAADDYGGTIALELHPDALFFTDDLALRRSLRESVAFCRAGLAGEKL
jgi:sugar phosphate isomerase/epimerase